MHGRRRQRAHYCTQCSSAAHTPVQIQQRCRLGLIHWLLACSPTSDTRADHRLSPGERAACSCERVHRVCIWRAVSEAQNDALQACFGRGVDETVARGSARWGWQNFWAIPDYVREHTPQHHSDMLVVRLTEAPNMYRFQSMPSFKMPEQTHALHAGSKCRLSLMIWWCPPAVLSVQSPSGCSIGDASQVSFLFSTSQNPHHQYQLLTAETTLPQPTNNMAQCGADTRGPCIRA